MNKITLPSFFFLFILSCFTTTSLFFSADISEDGKSRRPRGESQDIEQSRNRGRSHSSSSKTSNTKTFEFTDEVCTNLIAKINASNGDQILERRTEILKSLKKSALNQKNIEGISIIGRLMIEKLIQYNNETNENSDDDKKGFEEIVINDFCKQINRILASNQIGISRMLDTTSIKQVPTKTPINQDDNRPEAPSTVLTAPINSNRLSATETITEKQTREKASLFRTIFFCCFQEAQDDLSKPLNS